MSSPVRKHRDFCNVSYFDRGRLIGMKESDLFRCGISRGLNPDHTTIIRIWFTWFNEGIQINYPIGRPFCSSDVLEY